MCLKPKYCNEESVIPVACVDAIYQDNEAGKRSLKVEVRRFKEVKLSFTAPFDSSEIGSYHCQGGLETESLEIPFTDITQKCFMFPMKLPAVVKAQPDLPEQSWICQLIKHADLY